MICRQLLLLITQLEATAETREVKMKILVMRQPNSSPQQYTLHLAWMKRPRTIQGRMTVTRILKRRLTVTRIIMMRTPHNRTNRRRTKQLGLIRSTKSKGIINSSHDSLYLEHCMVPVPPWAENQQCIYKKSIYTDSSIIVHRIRVVHWIIAGFS